MVLQRRLGRANLRVVGMSLDVLLQVLGPLEGLATKFTLVRLQRDVDANVRGNMVALDGRCVASAPLASQVQVIGALAANMALTNVFLYRGPMSIIYALAAFTRPPEYG